MSDLSYEKSGVSIEEGNRFVDIIKPLVKTTFDKNVLGGLGGFSALYSLEFIKDYEHPVLACATDGIGTKLAIAIDSGEYYSVGIDLVAMCVNDLAVGGIKPLAFLDYIATGALDAEKMSELVEGIVAACKEVGASLVGGETAEMPGIYKKNDFDAAGFAVGVGEKNRIIDGSLVGEGDILIGLPSSGFHSNGYSLLRSYIFSQLKKGINDSINGINIKDALLTPTRLYVNQTLQLIEKYDKNEIKACVHITGGGFYENILRVLPNQSNLCVNLDFTDVILPEPYKLIEGSNIDPRELYTVFNMGIGFVYVVAPENKEKVMSTLRDMGETPYLIGDITATTAGGAIDNIDTQNKVFIKGIDY